MIEYEVAIEKILEHTPILSPKTTSLANCHGKVLAENIVVREPIPLFSSSAMDGFAVRAQDTQGACEQNPVDLPLLGMIQAGDSRQLSLKSRTAVKIFTGSPIPKGADSVVMKEFAREHSGCVSIQASVAKGENIRRRGEEYRQGTNIFAPGTIISPPVVGMLATLGYNRVKVFPQPQVAVIVTGNELRPPGAKLAPGQIRDANSYMLTAALARLGIQPIAVEQLKDNKTRMMIALSRVLAICDVLITVGGVSVGDYDFVKAILHKLKVRCIFDKVAMKPGKPNFFGIKGKKVAFGLPGNPVSALVSFELLTKIALYKMMGYQDSFPGLIKAELTKELTKQHSRMEFVRANLVYGRNKHRVTPVARQGSHMVGGIARANCLLHFPRNKSFLAKGSTVDVQILSWN